MMDVEHCVLSAECVCDPTTRERIVRPLIVNNESVLIVAGGEGQTDLPFGVPDVFERRLPRFPIVEGSGDRDRAFAISE
jgi:hypothetical protein